MSKPVIVIKAVHELARCLGGRRLEFELDGPVTVSELMQILVDRFGDELSRKFAPQGNSLWNVVVLVNGRNILAGEGRQTVVRNGDEVLFMSPVSGGR